MSWPFPLNPTPQLHARVVRRSDSLEPTSITLPFNEPPPQQLYLVLELALLIVPGGSTIYIIHLFSSSSGHPPLSLLLSKYSLAPTAQHLVHSSHMSSSSAPWDYIAKLVCIGDSGCGKSSLTIRLCEGRFSAHHDVTIGVEFGSRIVPVGPPHTPAGAIAFPPSSSSSADDAPPSPGGLPEPRRDTSSTPQKHMKLSLWDTAGQETYKSVTRSYFRGASGALLVFDLSRKATFQHATDWLNDLRQIAEPDIVIVLVGNKADLTQQEDNKREVTREEAEEWAKRNGILEYVETSAKSGENVEKAFMRVSERIYQNIQAGRYNLNDRRSGVKGPGAGGSRQVRLTADASKSGGGCC